jgi:hypothetical protein
MSSSSGTQMITLAVRRFAQTASPDTRLDFESNMAFVRASPVLECPEQAWP